MFLTKHVFNQTFLTKHVRKSQKVKDVSVCEIFDILFSYEDKDLGRFSNLH